VERVVVYQAMTGQGWGGGDTQSVWSLEDGMQSRGGGANTAVTTVAMQTEDERVKLELLLLRRRPIGQAAC